ncbi:MAG: helix-turn-helix domain-containing protein [Bacteroidales bacterium]|jgi:hypothetical protein|nr:helix-turn-helix domain-containing protein [Bacteroidales bacterium]
MSYELVETEKINLLLSQISEMQNQIKVLTNKQNSDNKKLIYTNKELMSLLGIGDKLIKKYRDFGKLGYHQEGDKYWYSSKDIDEFLKSNHYAAFSN